jgi:hypothetical protein
MHTHTHTHTYTHTHTVGAAVCPCAGLIVAPGVLLRMDSGCLRVWIVLILVCEKEF